MYLVPFIARAGLVSRADAAQARKTPAAIRYLQSHFEDRIKANKMVKIYLQNIRKHIESN